MEYQAQFELRLASAIKEVADFENNINKYMSEFGYDEKLSISTKIFNVNITTERELTEEEQYEIKTLLTNKVIESMPKYDIRLKSFSRKSKQLVSQSAE